MTAIPEDIDKTATDIVRMGHDDWGAYCAIAQALLSERNATRNKTLEEAAKIAENNDYFVSEGEFIATVIRKEKT